MQTEFEWRWAGIYRLQGWLGKWETGECVGGEGQVMGVAGEGVTAGQEGDTEQTTEWTLGAGWSSIYNDKNTEKDANIYIWEVGISKYLAETMNY